MLKIKVMNTLIINFKMFKSIHVMVLCIISLAFVQCDTSKSLVNQSPSDSKFAQKVEGCNVLGTVKDFTNMDDCQFLIEMEGGELLYPVGNINPDIPFYEGAKISFGYSVLGKGNDVIKGISCNEHNYVVDIMCMEEFKDDSGTAVKSYDDCQPIKNPFQITWLQNVISTYNPSKIYEYNYEVGYLYEFQFEGGSVVYDCLGNELCKTLDGPDCESLLGTLEEGELIMVLNNKK